MLGKTHVAAGVAASIAIIHPETTTELIATIVGGAVGGWICDIDVRKNKNSKDVVQTLILVAIISIVCIFIDYRLGKGMCEHIINSFAPYTLIKAGLFLVGIGYGAIFTSHRGFMHSIFAVIYFTSLLWLLYKPISIPFGIGYATHIILDIMNKKGLQLLFPLKKRYCLELCSSDGLANSILMYISIIAAFALIGWTAVDSFPKEHFSNYNNTGSLPLLTKFQWYLIFVNIIAFVIMVIDNILCSVSFFWYENQEFIHMIEHILGLAGGGLGVLLSFIVLKNKPSKDNFNWYILVISELICWIIIYLIVCEPFGIGRKTDHSNLYRALILIYYLIINILNAVLFFIDRDNRSQKKSKRPILITLGLVGGALGGLVIIMFTGRKATLPEFTIGFPVLITLHTFLIGYLFLYLL